MTQSLGDIPTVHIIAIDEQEMTVLQLVAEAILAMSEERDMPREPTEAEQTAFLAFCRRIKEM